MPALLPMLRPFAAALLLAGPTAAQTRTPPLPLPEFAGHSAAWWQRHLENDPAARERLTAGAADALPLLRWLLENGKDWSRASALDALTRMGPGAKPLWDVLFARLRDCDGKWPDTLCAGALVAIGEDRDELRELLLRHITRASDITLRGVCSEALATLRPDADALLLDAVAAGQFADEAWAIQLLVARGEHAVPALLAELDAEGARGRVARDALVQHGWTIADRLEAAGHADLAHRALTEWLLPAAARDGHHELAPLAPEPPAQHLPELLVSMSSRRGRHLSVWRGEESARGYRLRKVELEFVHGDEEGEGEWQVKCRESVVSRELALGMTRQLALLARAELTPHKADNLGWTTSDTFAVLVRATTAGERWLDESFVGTRHSGNEPQRFRAGLPGSVVSRLAGLAEWHDAKLDDADRAAVASCREQFADDAWLEERFAALEALLKR